MSAITTSTVLRKLGKLHKPPLTFLNFDTPFHLLLATILSAQCTDKRVNMVTPMLFKKYPTPQSVLKVPESEFKRDIFTCGHFNNKTRYIRAASKIIVEKFDDDIPQTMNELLTLPGVGRKTATVVLYAAFGKQEGIAVDTHVWRVSKRLGLTKAKTQDKIELDLMRQTPKEKWGLLHTLLISHGRSLCTARNRKCDECPFRKECPSSLVMGRKDQAKK